jgi:hypothetical protein
MMPTLITRVCRFILVGACILRLILSYWLLLGCGTLTWVGAWTCQLLRVLLSTCWRPVPSWRGFTSLPTGKTSLVQGSRLHFSSSLSFFSRKQFVSNSVDNSLQNFRPVQKKKKLGPRVISLFWRNLGLRKTLFVCVSCKIIIFLELS